MSRMVNKRIKEREDKKWSRELEIEIIGIQSRRRDKRNSSDRDEGEDMCENRYCSNYTHTHKQYTPSHSPA